MERLEHVHTTISPVHTWKGSRLSLFSLRLLIAALICVIVYPKSGKCRIWGNWSSFYSTFLWYHNLLKQSLQQMNNRVCWILEHHSPIAVLFKMCTH